MAEIILDNVTKRYPDGALAVDKINLDIADGEFVILVGPSGCGKSTTLNMIAGLEDITEGELRIGGQVVNQKSPKDRDIAMVFQSYALYPHMTVRQNMGFALKLAKTPQNVINEKVEEAARILDLTQHLDRKPGQPVRWPAAAGGDGPGHRPRPLRVPDGRAVVQPRRETAGADAHRGVPDPAPAGHHHGLRHPRPDRGHDARRPGRRDAQRHPPAGCLPAGAVRASGQPVRGRLHRLARDELHGRHPGGGQAAHRAGGHPAGRPGCSRR